MSKSRIKRKDSHKSSGPLFLKGNLDITRSGMGYIIVEDKEHDVMVRPNDFNTALHGDLVRVKITSDTHKAGRWTGIITEVLERKQEEFLGVLEIGRNHAFFTAETDKPMPDIFVHADKLNGAKDQDTVIVKITSWQKNKKPEGEVVRVMTFKDESDKAMNEILMDGGFPLYFPEKVLQESEKLKDSISATEIELRKDFRNTLTFTIDPVDAKDFDDALSIQKLPNGNLEIGVHIADVSHFVLPGTELDLEAYARATSVYLPDRVAPMLPEKISNELCSLRPHEDKCTFSVVFEITEEGRIKDAWAGKTLIHSDRRFTYEEVQEIIEAEEGGDHREEILLLNRLAQGFRKSRFKKGAINFSSQEIRFKLDENGKPLGIIVKESKEAHQLIEEFMLLANKAVAEKVAAVNPQGAPIPFPYRVHDTPDEAKLQLFVAFAKKYGHGFDTRTPQGVASSFNQLLMDVKGKPEQHVLEQLGIRTMAKAVYTAENIGHYGLGFDHYCHFTSPIRRYPDILVHRILYDLLLESLEPDRNMEKKCRHCSERERAAMDAERASNKYKQVEFMKQFVGDEFEGVISGVSSFGFWVETIEHKCEGLVNMMDLMAYDEFRHIESEYCLSGRRSGRQFRMGDKVNIRVVAANLSKRQLDYEWVVPGSDPTIRKKTSGKKSTFRPGGKKNHGNRSRASKK